MSNKNSITVNIVGHATVGKSTITKIIYDALKQHGIEVELSDETLLDFQNEYNFNEIMNEFKEKRIKAVKNKSKITLNEVQLGPDSLHNKM